MTEIADHLNMEGTGVGHAAGWDGFPTGGIQELHVSMGLSECGDLALEAVRAFDVCGRLCGLDWTVPVGVQRRSWGLAERRRGGPRCTQIGWCPEGEGNFAIFCTAGVAGLLREGPEGARGCWCSVKTAS